MEVEKWLLVEQEYSDVYELKIKQSVIDVLPGKSISDCYTVDPSEEWEQGEKEVIYLFPYSNVDRKKLKVFCENNGFTLTTKPSKATVAFIDPEKFSRTGGSNTTVKAEPFTNIDKHTFQRWAKSHLSHSIIDEEFTRVALHKNIYDQQKWNSSNGKYSSRYDTLTDIVPRRNRRDTTVYYPANSTLRSMDVTIYNEECLLALLNKGMTLTEQSFISVCKMLESNDTETLRMAYQVMCDVDYKSSAIYLLLIISKYDLTIANSPFATKTNFKGMLKFLGINKDSLYNKLSTGNIISCMKRLGLYNQTNVLKLSALQDIDFKTRIAKDLAEPLDVSSGFISDSDYLDIDCD